MLPGAFQPFDRINDLEFEDIIFEVGGGAGGGGKAERGSVGGGVVRPGEAIADVADPACAKGTCPSQVVVTNYRLKLFEPTKAGATLHVTVCSGHNLESADANGFSDPYALLCIKGSQHRSLTCPKMTQWKDQTLNPVWNETFVFEGVDNDARLSVKIFDHDQYSRDDSLGEVNIPNIAMWDGEEEVRQWSVSLKVMKDGKPGQGTVRLRLRVVWYASDVIARHCSIPLLSIDRVVQREVGLASAGQVGGQFLDVFTKTGRKLEMKVDDPETARSLYKILCEHPRSLEDSFCFKTAPGPREYKFSWHDVLERLTADDNPGMRGTRAEEPGSASSPLQPGSARARLESKDMANASAAEMASFDTKDTASIRQPQDHQVSSMVYSQRWRVVEANKGYEQCASYMEELILPASVTLEDVKGSRNFRTKNRFPYVSWLHPSNGAMIGRCSQPQTGMQRKQLNHDIQCLQKFASVGIELTVCDCRPWNNAQANRLKGGGTEANMKVDGLYVEFLEIGNIHDMRAALVELCDGVCQQKDHNKCAKGISAWLGHIHAVLKGSTYAAEVVESGESVIVHCSDGWDRTSQIVALSSLLLDGHYRTIEGFPELIEKDWLMAGHKFRDRNGLASKEDQEKHARESSPIFVQFLDCIAQIWKVYPRHFEYTLEFLAFILYHSFSGKYANFLCNNEKERRERRTREAGVCLWTEILASRDRWLNPLYDRDVAALPIVPCMIALHRLAFCEELYSAQSKMWDYECDAGRRTVHRRPSMEEEEFGHPIKTTYRRQSSAIDDGRLGKQRPWMNSFEPEVLGQQASSRSITAMLTREGSQLEPGSVTPFGLEPGQVPLRDMGSSFLGSSVEDGGEGAPPFPPKLQVAEDLLRKFLELPNDFPGKPSVQVTSHASYGDHVEYIIVTTSGGLEHQATQRYSEFSVLKKALIKYSEIRPEKPFPSRTMPYVRQSPKMLEERRRALDAWLQLAVQKVIDAETACYAMRSRLEADASPSQIGRPSIISRIGSADPDAESSQCDEADEESHGVSEAESHSRSSPRRSIPSISAFLGRSTGA